jgi:hypothetical protein
MRDTMVGHKTENEDAKPPSRPSSKPPTDDSGRTTPSRPEQKSRDIDLERVLYDPEYRQAVQESLAPESQAQAGRSGGKKPQKG